MCELVAAASLEPRPFGDLAEEVAKVEHYGVASFGWGVAWLDDEAGVVRRSRGLGRFEEEALADRSLLENMSSRFLVHLRRPSRLSTLQLADTQPFADDERLAWCHNGFLDRAEELRPAYAARLSGAADSEVGWQFFLDRIAEGVEVPSALRAVDDAFGGRVNLGYLGADGELSLYSRNDTNGMWRFASDEVSYVVTELHSDDASLFKLVFPRARDRVRFEPGSGFTLASRKAALAGPAS